MPINKIITTSFCDQNFYVGIDVHKKSWSISVRTSGIEVEHFTQQPDPAALCRHLKNKYKDALFYSAYEAGFSGTQAHTILCNLGIQNCIVHPGDIPQTNKQQTNKTDFHDSKAIAKYLEAQLLNSIYIMPIEQQERRALFRQREGKVKDITRCVNKLKGMLNFFGVVLPNEFADKTYISRNLIAWLQQLTLNTTAGTDTLQQYINELIYQRQQLLRINRRIKKSVSEYYDGQYKSLLSVPGIGPITAMGLLTETGDLSRFDKQPDEFASYLGLIPCERSSAEHLYSKHIQSRCNRHLRPLLIEAAWVAITKSPALLAFYKKHAGVNGKKAIIKVARKLSLIAKAVALTKTKYQEGYVSGKTPGM